MWQSKDSMVVCRSVYKVDWESGNGKKTDHGPRWVLWCIRGVFVVYLKCSVEGALFVICVEFLPDFLFRL